MLIGHKKARRQNLTVHDWFDDSAVQIRLWS